MLVRGRPRAGAPGDAAARGASVLRWVPSPSLLPSSHQVMLLHPSLQTDLSRTHSFHWPPEVPHRPFRFNRMETHLSLLISNIFLVPCQTWLLPQGAQRIVGEERIGGTGAMGDVCAGSSRSTGQQRVTSICARVARRHPGGLHGRGDA